MPYRYETHLHTCQASKCGRSTGKEHAQFYKEMGYQGIIVTDHFFGGNTAVDRTLPWRERIEWFCSGYEDAKAEGDRIGLDVFFGWEQHFDWDEYLVYGLDKQWLLDHPEMEHWTRREQFEQVHRYGGCVIQAHPFRDRSYMNHIYLGKRFCDGIEVANISQYVRNDAAAMHYAKAYDLVTIAGSDNHFSQPGKQLVGIELEEKLHSIHDFVRVIRNREPIGLVVPEGRFDPPEGEALAYDVFSLDENERPIPERRDWLHA